MQPFMAHPPLVAGAWWLAGAAQDSPEGVWGEEPGPSQWAGWSWLPALQKVQEDGGCGSSLSPIQDPGVSQEPAWRRRQQQHPQGSC